MSCASGSIQTNLDLKSTGLAVRCSPRAIAINCRGAASFLIERGGSCDIVALLRLVQTWESCRLIYVSCPLQSYCIRLSIRVLGKSDLAAQRKVSEISLKFLLKKDEPCRIMQNHIISYRENKLLSYVSLHSVGRCILYVSNQ